MFSSTDIARLPAMERDIMRLHMGLHKSQTEVARILGVSQPTVNYRYKRARERLKFMEQIPRVSGDEIREVLTKLGAQNTDIEAMVLYVETNSQSEVSRRMNTSQGAVRHWILRALNKHLEQDHNPDDMHWRVRTACSMLVDKPGMLNEPNKRGAHTPDGRRVEHRLKKAPKYQGRTRINENVRVLEGLYSKIDGTVVEFDEQEIHMQLALESQEIILVWPVVN